MEKSTKLQSELPIWVLAILLLALTPVFIIISVIIFTFRYFIQLLAQTFRPDLSIVHPFSSGVAQSETFNGKDASFNSLGILLLFSGELDILDLQDRFQNLLDLRRSDGSLLYKEMRQYITSWCGYTFWKNDDQFDLKNHISLMETNPDEDVTKERLNSLMKTLLTKPYHQKRSPWEIKLVPNVNFDAEEGDENAATKTALIFTWSHCLMDGYSFINLLKNLQDIQTNVSELPKVNYSRKRGNSSRFLFDICLYPFQVSYNVAEMILDFKKAQFSKWEVKDRIKTAENIHVWNEDLPSDLIKSIKSKFGVKFTSVLIAAVAGAIRQMSLKKGMVLEETMQGIFAITLPNHPDGLCNHVSGGIIKLPTGEPNIVHRLDLCDKTFTDATKFAQLGIGSSTLTVIGRNCNWVGKQLTQSLKAPVAISYLPCMMIDDLSINGHQLLHAHGFHQTFVGYGCSFLILGFRGRVRISGTVEGSILKSKFEIQELIQFIICELQELNSMK